MHELLTGDPPFRGRGTQLIHQHACVPPPPVRTTGEPVPQDLESLIGELLEKKVEDRPMSAAEVHRRLDTMEIVFEVTSGHGQGHAHTDTPAPDVPQGPLSPQLDERAFLVLEVLSSGAPFHEHTPFDTLVRTTVQETLEREGVAGTIVACGRGPVVSRYEIRLDTEEREDSIGGLTQRVAESLADRDVRFLPSYPSASTLPDVRTVGVEAADEVPDTVALGDLLRSTRATSSEADLLCAVGRNETGAVLLDLFEAPHLLVAGSPESGRSTALRAMIISLLVRSSPDRVRLLLVDSPDGAFDDFAGVPHLLFPVARFLQRAVASLVWLKEEMERRYDDLAVHGCRTVHEYNDAVRRGEVPPSPSCIGGEPPHPSIVAVVDELTVLRGWSDADRQLGEMVELARGRYPPRALHGLAPSGGLAPTLEDRGPRTFGLQDTVTGGE